MLLPLAAEVFGARISIGEPWYEFALGPILAVLFLFVPLAQAASWRRTEVRPLLTRYRVAAVLALIAGGAAFALYDQSPWLAPGLLVGVWLIAGVTTDFLRRLGGGGVGRLGRLSAPVIGMTLAHVGLGVFLIGAVAEKVARYEQTFALAPGETAELRGWTFRFEGVEGVEGPNYYADRGTIVARRGDVEFVMRPEKRYFPVAQTPTTEVSIRRMWGGHVYVSLGEAIRERPGVWSMRASFHPMIEWVFAGAGLIAIGGLTAMAGRRRRAAAAARPEAEPAAVPVPAGAAGATL
jgi:cytochrome c-type biogenesis protein CcmF